jgi:outer membrane protein
LWTTLAAVMMAASAVAAAEIEVGARYFYLRPADTGALDLQSAMGFGVTAEAFWTPRISTQLSASFSQPQAILGGNVDLGTLGINPVALTARFHMRPGARLSPFVGAGPALVMLGNLDDYFGDEVEADFEDEQTFLAEAGIRFRSGPHVAIELTVSRLWLTARPAIRKTNVALPSPLKIHPITAGGGISWRF